MEFLKNFSFKVFFFVFYFLFPVYIFGETVTTFSSPHDFLEHLKNEPQHYMEAIGTLTDESEMPEIYRNLYLQLHNLGRPVKCEFYPGPTEIRINNNTQIVKILMPNVGDKKETKSFLSRIKNFFGIYGEVPPLKILITNKCEKSFRNFRNNAVVSYNIILFLRLLAEKRFFAGLPNFFISLWVWLYSNNNPEIYRFKLGGGNIYEKKTKRNTLYVETVKNIPFIGLITYYEELFVNFILRSSMNNFSSLIDYYWFLVDSLSTTIVKLGFEKTNSEHYYKWAHELHMGNEKEANRLAKNNSFYQTMAYIFFMPLVKFMQQPSSSQQFFGVVSPSFLRVLAYAACAKCILFTFRKEIFSFLKNFFSDANKLPIDYEPYLYEQVSSQTNLASTSNTTVETNEEASATHSKDAKVDKEKTIHVKLEDHCVYFLLQPKKK